MGSSDILGAAGTAYPAAPFGARGLEVNNPDCQDGDGYTVAGNTLLVTMRVSEPGDWIRVVTECRDDDDSDSDSDSDDSDSDSSDSACACSADTDCNLGLCAIGGCDGCFCFAVSACPPSIGTCDANPSGACDPETGECGVTGAGVPCILASNSVLCANDCDGVCDGEGSCVQPDDDSDSVSD